MADEVCKGENELLGLKRIHELPGYVLGFSKLLEIVTQYQIFGLDYLPFFNRSKLDVC